MLLLLFRDHLGGLPGESVSGNSLGWVEEGENDICILFLSAGKTLGLTFPGEKGSGEYGVEGPGLRRYG